MKIKAVLYNKDHLEYGLVTIPFPIPADQYDSTIQMLEALDIGDPRRRDCAVKEILGPVPSLKRLEGAQINVDELDYLVKRLDSFSDGEIAQFQAMAFKLGKPGRLAMTGLIDLTFSCQKATVITDFSDLEQIGRAHYMNLHGGCASMEELEQLDARETALELILNDTSGQITPYGVVYDNGMKLEQVYDGLHLPCYCYGRDMLAVGLLPQQESLNPSAAIWIYLPATETQISRAVARSGAAALDELFWYETGSMFPEEVDAALDFKREDLFALNALAKAVIKLSQEDYDKLGAVVSLAKPKDSAKICRLAKNLAQFDLFPGIHTPESYGKHIIQESGGSSLSLSLDGFCDYTGIGLRQMEQEQGVFTIRGYVAYHGTLSLEELMMEDSPEQYQKEQEERLGMGGLS